MSDVEAWQPSARELERRAVRRSLRRRVAAGLDASRRCVVLGAARASARSPRPGWPTVKETFFNWTDAKASFPRSGTRFWTYNVKLFLIGEVLILVARRWWSRWCGSRRARRDCCRCGSSRSSTPTSSAASRRSCWCSCWASGCRPCGSRACPTSLFFWGLVALVLSYGAYVAEVIRAGIESIHPSQIASADALGLSPDPGDALRRGPPGASAASSRRCSTTSSPAEGHRPGRRRSASSTRCSRPRTTPTTTSTTRRYVVVACYFIVLTIPLARFTDHLQRRAHGAGEAGCPVSDALLEVTDLRKCVRRQGRPARHRPDRRSRTTWSA